MLCTVRTAALAGIDAITVALEADVARQGMPAFTLVGLPDGAVREAKERVFAALKNCGFRMPPARITVNLAPADVRKEGSGYDLPLAVGLLGGAEVVPAETAARFFFAGELSLTGELRPVTGVLPLAVRAKADGAAGIIVPRANAREAAVVEGLAVYGAATLAEVVDHLSGERPLPSVRTDVESLWRERETFHVDFAEVKGQEHAKRAIEIAASGGHNLLFSGPPGSGKTMLAARVPTVLPPLGFDEALEVTKIYSVAGMLPEDRALLVTRPFRAPHHTISDAGLIGGGAVPRPGEVSLAHRGVLFLDELPEFKKPVLEVLRQPLEGGSVTISRAAVALSYPADFMLVAAMNPCPCGFLTDERHACTCTPQAVARYRARLSGPLLDRIDLHVEVPAVPYEDLRGVRPGTASADIRGRVLHVRRIQADRYAGEPIRLNAELSGKLLDQHCALGQPESAFLEKAVRSLALSARAYTRILRLARTIADLAGEDRLAVQHLAEAINYRSMDRGGLV